MPRRSPEVHLTELQREILTALSRAKSKPARLVERAKVAVHADRGLSDGDIATKLGVDVDRQRVRRWRHRWLAEAPRLRVAEDEGADRRQLQQLIEAALSDKPRSGGPPKFSAEQVARLISLACEPPEDSGVPITHWTPNELAQEAVKRGIVESISPRHLDRLLKRGGPPPSQEPVLDDVEGQA